MGWIAGDCGLRERGEEKVRVGRGRGVGGASWMDSESEDEEMTEAFLLRSASVGEDSSCSISNGDKIGRAHV